MLQKLKTIFKNYKTNRAMLKDLKYILTNVQVIGIANLAISIIIIFILFYMINQ